MLPYYNKALELINENGDTKEIMFRIKELEGLL